MARLKSITASEWIFFALFCFFFFAYVIWVCLDRTVPVWDSARHLLDTYKLRDALSAPVRDSARHLLDTYKLKDALSAPMLFERRIRLLLTCAGWYPPLFNWVHLAFLMAPIPYAVADNLPRLVFFAIGIISLYNLGRQLFHDSAVGLVATAICFALPAWCVVSHSRGLLDMPLASMCFLGLWLIARWNAAPSLANAFLAGCGITLACMTKQMGIAYLGPAIFLVLLQRLLARDFGKVIQFCLVLGITAIPYLGWFRFNHGDITYSLGWNAEHIKSEGSGPLLWLKNLELYSVNLVRTITVPVSILFVLSLFNFPAQRKLWLPASTLPAFFYLCTLGWGSQDVRYLLPIIGYLTLSVAALLVRLWRTGKRLLKFFDVALGLYLFSIFFIYNFTPYPIPRCDALYALLDSKFSGVEWYWPGVMPAEPYPLEPLAYNWLLVHVQFRQSESPSKIVLAVGSSNCEASSIELLARQRGIPVEVTNLYKGSPMGIDRCVPNDVELYPDWYVTMKNDQNPHPRHFRSEHDLESYNRLKEYFETSDKFSKVGEFLYPDGQSCMVLYGKVEEQPTSEERK